MPQRFKDWCSGSFKDYVVSQTGALAIEIGRCNDGLTGLYGDCTDDPEWPSILYSVDTSDDDTVALLKFICKSRGTIGRPVAFVSIESGAIKSVAGNDRLTTTVPGTYIDLSVYSKDEVLSSIRSRRKEFIDRSLNLESLVDNVDLQIYVHKNNEDKI